MKIALLAMCSMQQIIRAFQEVLQEVQQLLFKQDYVWHHWVQTQAVPFVNQPHLQELMG
jgi:hypothetical protein